MSPGPSWTDAHCHLQVPNFANDLDEVFRRSQTFAIRRWVVCGTRPDDWDAVHVLARTRPGVRPQFGAHPWEVENLPKDWDTRLREHLLRHPDAGVGEIGLDRKLTQAPMELQLSVFVRQLEIARDLARPCTLHIVGAWAELHRAFERAVPPRFLLHAYGGSAEQVEPLLKRGAWFSFGGALIRQTHSDKLRDALRAVPGERLLLETDSPYQHPDGKEHRQEPAGLLRIAGAAARIRNLPVDRLREITQTNADRFLAIPDSA